MEVFDFANVRSLASVILWQYDNAENLQKLIWHTVREMSSSGTTENVQNGILQRMLDYAHDHFDEFYKYVFSALVTAEDYENTMETQADITDMTDVGKLFFGLTVWSRLTGLTRPQYTNNGVTYNVPLLSWARYMRAETQKAFSNGTCYEINRYMRVLLPHYNVYVVDNGSSKSDSYMTQSFRYRPDFVYTGTVTYESASAKYVVTFAIDTSVNAQGSALNRFVQVVEEGGTIVYKRAVWCENVTAGTGKVLLTEGEDASTHNPNGIFTDSGNTMSWSSLTTDGIYRLTVGSGSPLSPSAYASSDGVECLNKDGSPRNILAGAPNIGEMMKIQYVDEYLLIKADEKTISVGGTQIQVSGLFPHPAGVLSSSQSELKFGNISDFIGLNDSQASGQNAAVINHGILYSQAADYQGA